MGRSGCFLKVATVITVVFLLLSSCATKTKIEYVDREVVRYDTKIQHDTLINNVHDSIFHTIIQKGDTVYNIKYVERIKYKDRTVVRVDTCYQDSITTQVKEVVREVKQKPSLSHYFSCILIAACLLLTIKYAIRWIQKH